MQSAPFAKGRVENCVGYVKKNFLAGCEFIVFSAVQPAAQLWVDTVADVRVHGATQRRPGDMLRRRGKGGTGEST
ncbi:MAG TPA: hypothetical protein VF524_03215 [Polyangia bacterium]